MEPSAATYETRREPAVDAPTWTFGKGTKGEKSPEPDFRRAINPDIAITKKNPTITKIAPPREITDLELMREWEEK